MVVDGAWNSYSRSLEHVVCKTHCRLEVGEPGYVMYSSNLQVVAFKQTRSDVDVGASISYVPGKSGSVHSVRFWQTVSEELVKRATTNSDDEHLVMRLQVRSEVGVENDDV